MIVLFHSFSCVISEGPGHARATCNCTLPSSTCQNLLYFKYKKSFLSPQYLKLGKKHEALSLPLSKSLHISYYSTRKRSVNKKSFHGSYSFIYLILCIRCTNQCWWRSGKWKIFILRKTYRIFFSDFVVHYASYHTQKLSFC